MRRDLPETDLWIVDECHILFDFYIKELFPSVKAPIIGLSATPWTRGLGKLFSKLVMPTTMRALQEAINPATGSPFLVTENVLAPVEMDLGDVRTVAGDYHKGELGEKMNKPDLIGDIVATWQREGEGRSTIMFGVDRAHAMATHQQFLRAGISSGYVDGFSDRATRQAVRERFERGEIKVVCSIGCLTTGVDWDVRCIILARPTKSEMLFVQMIGRGMRPAEGKDDVKILDHTSTYQRLGFAADITHDELHDGTPRAKLPIQKKLPSICQGQFEGQPCRRVKQPGEHMCKRCGFAPERQNKITFADGKLGAMEAARRADEATQIDWYAQLKYVANERRYQPGWIAHKFKAKFGDWPPKSWRYSVAAEPAGRELYGFLRHLEIKERYQRARGPGSMTW